MGIVLDYLIEFLKNLLTLTIKGHYFKLKHFYDIFTRDIIYANNLVSLIKILKQVHTQDLFNGFSRRN